MNTISSTNALHGYQAAMADTHEAARVFPLRAESGAKASASTGTTAGNARFSKARAIFKGAVIVGAATAVVIVVALQAAARLF
ncbi:MAG: hypothetical protein ABJA83_16025 [Burkholderiaceae bacterium]